MKKSSLIIGAITLVLIATCIKGALNAFVFDNGVAWNDPKSSILLSQAAGVFVFPAKAQPNEFQWKGSDISFGEIWIERQVKTTFPYIWFYSLKPSGKDLLCFTLDKGRQAFGGSSEPFFVADGSHGSFAKVGGGKLFYSELSPADLSGHKMEVSLVQNWKDAGSQSIEFTW